MSSFTVACDGCGGAITRTDAASDASVRDSGDSADYHDLTDTRFWTSTSLASLLSPRSGLESGGFDGRYIYWHAAIWDAEGGVATPLVRYDTQGAFNDAASWARWDVSTTNSNIWYRNSVGPVLFDGRYIYLGAIGFNGKIQEVRYDTNAPFGDGASLAVSIPVQTQVPDGGSGDIFGRPSAIFEGRYIYFPDFATAAGLPVRRYDTQADFKDRFAWSFFNPQVNAMPPAIFVAPYVVLTPAFPPNGALVLYDTRLPFADLASWTSATAPQIANVPMTGVGSDGRYVYFVPSDTDPWQANGIVARFDTTASPTSPGAWQKFQTTQLHPLAKTFDHVTWDGRFFYFMVGSDRNGGNAAVVVRYDTIGDFQSTASWSAFDMTPILPSHARPLTWGGGVVFDGEYIYVPVYYDTPIIMRFDARTPRKMPPGFSGSFY